MIEIKKFEVGEILTNCYLVKNCQSGCSLLVDPGGEINNFEDELSNTEKIEYILLTHGHFDHILKAKEYRDITGAKIAISNLDSEFTNDNDLNLSDKFLRRSKIKLENFSADVLLNDGDNILFGEYKIQVMNTPGHTRGSVCYILNDVIFSGDTLFSGKCGSTRFPTGNSTDLNNSLKKLYSLEGEYKLYPGHSELTLLSKEKENHTGL